MAGEEGVRSFRCGSQGLSPARVDYHGEPEGSNRTGWAPGVTEGLKGKENRRAGKKASFPGTFPLKATVVAANWID